MIWLFWILAALAVIAGLVVLASYICCRLVYSVDRDRIDPRKPDTNPQYFPYQEKLLAAIDAADAIPYEEVRIRSSDGLELYGRYYETAPGAPVQIQFHGYRGSPLRDFCVGLPLALEYGCNVLLVDQRAHGRSEGKYLTFGVLERQDCLDWVNYVRQRFGEDTPVVLSGVSMGAAMVMMAAGLELPGNVKGIIADCGYNSPKEILIQVMTDVGYPKWPTYPLIRLGGRIFGGFDVEGASAETAMARCTVPVLFIHGDEDRFVPCWMSQRDYDACAAPKKMVIVPGAPHAISYVVAPDTYRAAVRGFLQDIGVVEKQEQTV